MRFIIFLLLILNFSASSAEGLVTVTEFGKKTLGLLEVVKNECNQDDCKPSYTVKALTRYKCDPVQDVIYKISFSEGMLKIHYAIENIKTYQVDDEGNRRPAVCSTGVDYFLVEFSIKDVGDRELTLDNVRLSNGSLNKAKYRLL